MYYQFEIIKCLGTDEIILRILKMTVDTSRKALTLIFNRSLTQEEIPNDWKSANVVPILKRVQRVIKIIIDQLV